MPVTIGTVQTFPNPQADKAQVVKIAEEYGEIYSAWERWTILGMQETKARVVEECADLITATCNLLAALGVDDMKPAMAACHERNHARGRL